MKKLLATLAFIAIGVSGLTACSTPEPIAVTADTTIIDVRTSGEYEAGHLSGAINIDVQAADFETRLAELPTDGRYIVYCASGNRSGAAVARMVELGFTAVADAGGMSAASDSTGIAVVTD